ncbi:hypothetical protein BG015_010336 [Linnemannia schmuckeri]|uniref:AAA+ ATPase domain-containing protein n=1 Tax=Linnemannia schmuckeri TaxID=64567 RepID=A0A9P5VEK7_9FUNG|nr:hypothetical protein BG015_010336 [Linnemannia schmuckeri]
MSMQWQVIASVDDTKRSRDLVSGGRESTPSARPIVYISREQSIQYKLRNSVVALSLAGAAPEDVPLYALVKVYSQQSALFSRSNRFPQKLDTHQLESGSGKFCDVVVSNLLWWELQQQQRRQSTGALREFHEDSAMPIGNAPIIVYAKLINDIGNATQLTVIPTTYNNHSRPPPKGAAIAQSLSGAVVSLNGWISYRSPYGAQTFQIIDISTTSGDLPNVGIMSEATSIRIRLSTISRSGSSGILVSKEEWIDSIKGVVGGYDDVLSEIVDHLYGYLEDAVSSTRQTDVPSCFRTPMKGIMISGRPGTGKSVLASSLAEHSGLPYTVINCPDVFQPNAGASENYLRSAFSSLLAKSKASIVILDEVDMIASTRSSRKGVEARMFATLLHLVDSINTQLSGNKIFVIALTNRLHAVDSSLVRSGRLDKLYDLHLKGVNQRLGALRILSKDLPIDSSKREDILLKVAKVTHGFVPTDLQALCVECALALISQMAAGQPTVTPVVDISYFDRALKTIRPSGMGEFLSKIPTVTFSDLYGIQDAITDLKVSIIEPFHNPGKYIDLGISPPRGVIVHGPPGVGKTMLCCALAEELGINFMLVESSQIRSKVVGESEKNIARMFAQAKANAPCILFIDQIDVLAPSRGSTNTSENSGDRIVTGLLTEMDGFFTGSAGKSAQVDVLVLAATNRPEVIDSAILRPGRLDQIVYIPVPDQKTRQAILEGYMNKMPMRITSEEIQTLAQATEGYSGADLENLCREAALICLRQDITNTEITLSHLESAKLVSKPSLLGYENQHLFSR